MPWLLKTEPTTYGIDHLEKQNITCWEGVRNYQARNLLKNTMKIGELCFFYHSNCDLPGIYGLCKVCSTSYPDPTQFDPKSKYYDPKSSIEQSRWYLVDVAFIEKYPHPYSLTEIKQDAYLADMLVCKQGTRLSVQPVEEKHFTYLLDKIHLKQKALLI